MLYLKYWLLRFTRWVPALSWAEHFRSLLMVNFLEHGIRDQGILPAYQNRLNAIKKMIARGDFHTSQQILNEIQRDLQDYRKTIEPDPDAQ